MQNRREQKTTSLDRKHMVSLNNQESVTLTLVTYDAPTSGILPPLPTELRAEFQTHAGQLPN